MRPAIVQIALIMAIALASPGIAGPFEDGVAAYEQAQFAAAFNLWLPLAEQGDIAAQFNVGVLYENGTGVAKDSAEAARWYLKAAQQGYAQAQYRLALVYETGAGLTRDPAQARSWYDKVLANQGADEGLRELKERARQRLAGLANVTQDVIPFEGGRFVLVHAQDGNCVIALQGTISRDADLKFDDVMAASTKRGCNNPWLVLESFGGGVLDGLSIGKDVRTRGIRTMTRYECASACAIIFVGGTERVLVGSRAKIGLHQPTLVRLADNVRRCATSMESSGMRDLRSYLRWTLDAAAGPVMDEILRTPCDAIEWFGGKRAVEMGIATRFESEGVDVFGPKAARQ